MDITDRFLEHACLGYDGGDGAERRSVAEELLRAHPELGEDDLHVAAALGRVASVRSLLEQTPEGSGAGRRDPLLYLAFSRVHAPDGDPLATARALLDAGADPNASFQVDEAVFTALTGVMGEGEQGFLAQPPHPQARELAEILLDAGASPNESQGLYNTMFRSDDRWLELFLARGLRAEHRIYWNMGHPEAPRTLDFVLAHAVEAGFAKRVKLLLQHGADASGVSPYHGRRYVTSALLRGHAAIAEILAQSGAPTNPGSPDEGLRLACLQGAEEEARRLAEEHPALLQDPSHLIDAASSGDVQAMTLLLDLGAPVNATGKSGASALHHGALGGREDVVRLLLARGADPEQVEPRFGCRPAGWALHAGHGPLARLLEPQSP